LSASRRLTHREINGIAKPTASMTDKNALYYGDNLEVLRRYVKDESVDLIYLDPPFKSDQDYNVLFAERNGAQSTAQVKAFKDTWRWDQEAALAYQQTVEAGGPVSEAMQAFRKFFGENDMLAYLAMMAPRLVELRRVLKPTGSIYLHCDPTASHFLKLLMDSVFGVKNFRNEVVWKRTYAHGSARRYGSVHDVILFYTRSEDYTWTGLGAAHDPDYIARHFIRTDPDTGRRFQPISLTGSGTTRGESGEPWRDIDPSEVRRHWALPGAVLRQCGIDDKLSVQAKLDKLDEAGLIYWPKKSGGTPRLKWFLDELKGASLTDNWIDINPISARAKERLGYPTQKPESLLVRIIRASSNEGDLVLDPFCGCGTTVAVAQRLKRRWIGIDITHLAVTLTKYRLENTFREAIKKEYVVIGEPVSISGAMELARQNPYQFKWWALGLVGARPVEEKKGADKGIDGRLYFHDEGKGAETKQIILSVKSGHVTVSHIRDLRGVMDRDRAEIGVLVTMRPPTKDVKTEAASADFYYSPGWDKHYPRIQVLTVEDIMRGEGIDYPPSRLTNVTFKRAPKAKKQHSDNNAKLFDGEIDDD